MLDRADCYTGFVADHGAECEVLDVADIGWDFSHDAAAFAD